MFTIFYLLVNEVQRQSSRYKRKAKPPFPNEFNRDIVFTFLKEIHLCTLKQSAIEILCYMTALASKDVNFLCFFSCLPFLYFPVTFFQVIWHKYPIGGHIQGHNQQYQLLKSENDNHDRCDKLCLMEIFRNKMK